MRFKALIEKYNFLQLFAIYIAAMAVVLLGSILAFFFPIMPLCYIFNIEFSNLGPIATAAWGILFNILILTPAFIYAIVIKIRQRNNKAQLLGSCKRSSLRATLGFLRL